MKTIVTITALLLFIMVTSCVQKSYKRIVVFTLDASQIKEVKKVGIRGKDKPFSWDYDTELKFSATDSLYQVTTTFDTGYKFTEVKFVVNDTFEFQNQDNRRVHFSDKDTTFFKAKFNKR
jgi:hypothetical protein